ncbi:hypothetical protein [Roseivivax sp. THAF197b]|uniref:hypothetical protein n=1 Tax=Roseivivax sp. THAF197b TaxID=2588299 RepID=UPI001268BAA3|nr:hypothetical protein [Roseivivax sp. THAF197b]QFS83984.1 hypothetical protein FIV09_14200 [Roseivivax sp. THAF197b]
MPSPQETITLALVDALAPHIATILRKRELPEICPLNGLINVMPEDPREEGERLGDGVREWSQVFTLEVVVQNADETARSTALDTALREIATLLIGSNLGGAVDYLRLDAPQESEVVPMDGAASLKAATMPVTVFYETTQNPMETL